METKLQKIAGINQTKFVAFRLIMSNLKSVFLNVKYKNIPLIIIPIQILLFIYDTGIFP